MRPRLERVRVPDTFPRDRSCSGSFICCAAGSTTSSTSRDLIATGPRTSTAPGRRWRKQLGLPAGRWSAAAEHGAASATAGWRRPGGSASASYRSITVTRRQWYGDGEFELTPLHHRLLAVMAADPFRVFGKDELLGRGVG